MVFGASYQQDPRSCPPGLAEGCFSVTCTWTSPSQEYKTHTETHEPLLYAPDEANILSMMHKSVHNNITLNICIIFNHNHFYLNRFKVLPFFFCTWGVTLHIKILH